MTIPSSGPLNLRATINQEINQNNTDINVSLRGLSAQAQKSIPDAMSEFYGYSSVTAPAVSTVSATSIGTSSFTARGSCTVVAGGVTSRGFKWMSGNQSRTTLINSGNTVTAGSGTGSFSAGIGGLAHTTTYSYVAWAENAAGRTYASNTAALTTTTPITPPSIRAVYGNVGQICSTAGGQGCYNDGGPNVSENFYIFATSAYGQPLSYYWEPSGTATVTSGQGTLSGTIRFNNFGDGFTLYVSEAGYGTTTTSRSIGQVGCCISYTYLNYAGVPNIDYEIGLFAWGNPIVFYHITPDNFNFTPFIATTCPQQTSFTSYTVYLYDNDGLGAAINWQFAGGDDWNIEYTIPNINTSERTVTMNITGPGVIC